MHLKLGAISKLLFLFFSLLGIAKNSFSQNDGNGKIVAFHPSAGNTITLEEKKTFEIFSEYSDSLFQSAQLVKYSADNYSVLIKTISGESFEKPIAIKELDDIYARIEKVKPAKSLTKPEEDYVEEKQTSDKKIKKDNRSETGYIVGEIVLQVLFVFLEILAKTY